MPDWLVVILGVAGALLLIAVVCLPFIGFSLEDIERYFEGKK